MSPIADQALPWPAEAPFRISVFVVMALTMSVAAYYRLQAARGGERISHREEGYLFAAILRFCGLGLWLAVLAYLIFPDRVAWAAIGVPPWLRWAGLAGGLGCSLLMYWTLSSLGKNLTDTVVTRAEARLVTQGSYRWVRHPFYVTVALLMASVTLLSSNALIGVLSFLVLAMLAIRTPKEEQMLAARFGSEYEAYRARTGRFFPRWGR